MNLTEGDLLANEVNIELDVFCPLMIMGLRAMYIEEMLSQYVIIAPWTKQ